MLAITPSTNAPRPRRRPQPRRHRAGEQTPRPSGTPFFLLTDAIRNREGNEPYGDAITFDCAAHGLLFMMMRRTATLARSSRHHAAPTRHPQPRPSSWRTADGLKPQRSKWWTQARFTRRRLVCVNGARVRGAIWTGGLIPVLRGWLDSLYRPGSSCVR
jgi:hypothetical protein